MLPRHQQGKTRIHWQVLLWGRVGFGEYSYLTNRLGGHPLKVEIRVRILLGVQCRDGGMADPVDSKSTVRKDMRVRLPLSALV